MVSVNKLSRNNQITTQHCDKTIQKMKLKRDTENMNIQKPTIKRRALNLVIVTSVYANQWSRVQKGPSLDYWMGPTWHHPI